MMRAIGAMVEDGADEMVLETASFSFHYSIRVKMNMK